MPDSPDWPLYVDEAEVARRVMGKHAPRWPEVAKIEERCGLPKVDPLLGGRYWPGVKAYFDFRHGLQKDGPKPPDGGENWAPRVDGRRRKAPGIT